MRMLAVYQNPTDYPDQYVVRGFTIAAGQVTPDRDPLYVGGSLRGARAAIVASRERGPLTRLMRDEHDEPQIVEVWI